MSIGVKKGVEREGLEMITWEGKDDFFFTKGEKALSREGGW